MSSAGARQYRLRHSAGIYGGRDVSHEHPASPVRHGPGRSGEVRYVPTETEPARPSRTGSDGLRLKHVRGVWRRAETGHVGR